MNQYFLMALFLTNGPVAYILAGVDFLGFEFPGLEFLGAAPSWFSRVRV
jgi:hypothetical protein